MPVAPSLLSRLLPWAKPDTKGFIPPAWYGQAQTFVQPPGQAVWGSRNYLRFSEEAYRQNAIAHRVIGMIAKSAASVPLLLADDTRRSHPVLSLLAQPNPTLSGRAFMEALYGYRLISGNAYILAIGPSGEAPAELHLLRPDRVQVLTGSGPFAIGYRYTVGEQSTDYPIDPIRGASKILHLKDFHPANDYYGLSPLEPAAFAIDQHNQAASWNQALLQNGARPSGALVVKMDAAGGTLSEGQYHRLKHQVDEQFSGALNAGRPLLLEGGLEWKEMSLSPKDMDFTEMKHSAAREIALAFGVPPQLLGIPGDNTYANLAEARLALWEQRILPMLDETLLAISQWLSPFYGEKLSLQGDIDQVSALTPRRDDLWARVGNAAFLSDDEKRQAVGYPPRQNSSET